jgi:putative peptide zinc metalloprotease protein
MRTIARLLLATLQAVAAGPAAPALAQSQDNTAVATNTKDGKSVFKLAFSVKKVTGDVDATNTAVAYSSCTDCRTVAVAIQIVLVSEVDAATPENVAVAINYDCTECETLARAFQFVYGDGEELEFTKEGKARLHDLKKRVQDLKQRDDLTLAQLAQELAVIAAEVAEVVDEETQVKQPSAPATPATTTTTTTPATTSTSIASSTTTSTPATATTVAPTSTTTTAPTTTTAAPTTTSTSTP